MHIALVILALLVAAGGAVSLSQATMGAGLIAAGCLLGILARMAQAGRHQAQLLRAMGVVDERGERIDCHHCGAHNRASAAECWKCHEPLHPVPATA
jgi:hypothetical protein